MKYVLYLLLPLQLMSATTFITQMEYASQLYKNPRGIGCQHCHGMNGEGKLIANYISKNEQKSFRGPAINKGDFADFYKALDKRKDGMPRYFLTEKEVKALYFYLHQENYKKENKKVKKVIPNDE